MLIKQSPRLPDESNTPKPLHTPIKPSERNVEEHNMVHLPYRDWCPDLRTDDGDTAPHQRLMVRHGVVQLDFPFSSVPGTGGKQTTLICGIDIRPLVFA